MPRQANSGFAEIPEAAAEALHAKGWHFHNFIGAGGQRFMCSWDTTDGDVDAPLRDLVAAMEGHSAAH